MTSRRPPAVQPARRLAFDVLVAVRESDAYANLLLPARLRRAGLESKDAALATELVYGTLRMRGYYDRIIALAAGREVEKIDAGVLDVLRLGTHQLLGMRVAAHAAVGECVSLARQVASRAAAGFCNAVLRAIARAEPEQWRERVLDAATSADDRLAAEYSHPAWIVRAFRQALVAEGAGDELAELLAADNRAPAVTLAALPALASVPDDAERTRLSPVGFLLGRGNPARVVDGSGGRIRVQDEGSQLAALTLTRARPVLPGERWLDLCAGPGGKAALLAAEAREARAELVANEPVPARAGLVAEALAAVPAAATVTEVDGRSIGRADPGGFDRILLDAPCTGLGALRRRPEARWRKRPRDVGELTRLQSELFDAAVEALKPGGILVYVTCSPHLAETREVVAGALDRHRGLLEQLDTGAIVRSFTRTDPAHPAKAHHVQLWPHRHGTDAMFIAALTRVN